MANVIELKRARNAMHHAQILKRAHYRYLDYRSIKESIGALVRTHGINQMFMDSITFNNQRRILSLMTEEKSDIAYHYGLLRFRFYRNGYVELSFI